MDGESVAEMNAYLTLCSDHRGYGSKADCIICKKRFGPKLAEWIKLISDEIKNKKLVGISGHNFVDHIGHMAVMEGARFKRDEKGDIIYNSLTIKANSSPELYCISMARISQISIEAMAEDLIRIHSAPLIPIRECRSCLAFLSEEELKTHDCAP